MTGSAYGQLEKLESDLWEAADQLRANSKLTSSEYCMPVLGVIFLRHATNRFAAAHADIEAERAAGQMKRKPRPADYVRRRALYLPEIARYDYILGQSKDRPLPKLLNDAMKAIEESFEPLMNVLPKDYHIFTDQTVLEELLKIFNREAIKTASGDIFGRIYEYFLMKFAIDKAMDNGEFFTPPSIVQTIVNVIEPDHGKVADIACGSGGMFVQSSYFIENEGEDTAKRVTFYGHEKTASTIKLAKMNLAVHGLEGKIAEANTFYEDPFTLVGKCDFVMANPPFNVDLVDAKKAEADKKRLPFGLPGVNKAGKVSNGNYLWISYFHSYLKDVGRAGFVMSSQASSAGRDEQTVRRKIVETGAVDVMIAIRSNFFYTRSVPCELWFFDRGKAPERQDKVLMLDARSVFRKVTRKVNDFSPEQLANLSSIVWLYRGQTNRFVELVDEHIDSAINAAHACFLDETLMCSPMDDYVSSVRELRALIAPFTDSIGEETQLEDVLGSFLAVESDPVGPVEHFRLSVSDTQKQRNKGLLEDDGLSQSRDMLENTLPFVVGSARELLHSIDLHYRRAAKLCAQVESDPTFAKHEKWDRRAIKSAIKKLAATREVATEHVVRVPYFAQHAHWLLSRFPDAKLVDVPGLVKLVDRAEIEAADWSLTPGRYVGVAPPETDEDFDFEQTMRDIHVELADLNKEAVDLAARIQTNFQELGI